MTNNVLTIGDICSDITLHASIARSNPENLIVPLFDVDNFSIKPGMSKNVSDGLANLGFNSINYLGNTTNAGSKYRLYDTNSKNYLLRLDYPNNSTIIFDRAKLESICEYNNFNYVVISDYDKGLLSYNDIHAICNHFKDANCIFLDTKKTKLYQFHHYKNLLLKINAAEAAKVKFSEGEIPKNCIVTLGAEGARDLRNNQVYNTTYNKALVVDVCGAGDAFLAGLVYGQWKCDYEGSTTLPIYWALRSGSICVTKHGTYIPSKSELEGKS